MDPIVLYILSFVIVTSFTIVCCFGIYFIFYKKRKNEINAKFSLIYIGMTESELFEECGYPQKTLKIDKNVKVATYVEGQRPFFRWQKIKVTEITILLKDGIVTKIN